MSELIMLNYHDDALLSDIFKTSLKILRKLYPAQQHPNSTWCNTTVESEKSCIGCQLFSKRNVAINCK